MLGKTTNDRVVFLNTIKVKLFISAISNETKEAANELSKSVERQLHSVEKLNDTVGHLQENAMDLDISVSIFKIE